MIGSIVRRKTKSGAVRYCAVWRVGARQKWKSFGRRRDAEGYLTRVVKAVQEGSYQDIQPLLLSDIFNRWLENSLDVRVKQGLLKPSTVKSYRSMIEKHLRPAFGDYRSDRLSHAEVSAWVKRMADEIAEGNLGPKSYNNLLNLLHSIFEWARHPAQ